MSPPMGLAAWSKRAARIAGAGPATAQASTNLPSSPAATAGSLPLEPVKGKGGGSWTTSAGSKIRASRLKVEFGSPCTKALTKPP